MYSGKNYILENPTNQAEKALSNSYFKMYRGSSPGEIGLKDLPVTKILVNLNK